MSGINDERRESLDDNFVNAEMATSADENSEPPAKCCSCSSLTNMWGKYDHSFMTLYCLQYFNAGLKILIALAMMDMFKNDYGLQPTATQVLMTFVFFPWSIKFFFGVLADTVPICGSRKKSWLCIMGCLQFVSMITLAILTPKSANVATFYLTVSVGSGAFNDVIVDALMVIQAKRDPEKGSQELQTLAWGTSSIAMMIGGICAAFLTEFLNPYYCYVVYGLFGLFCVLNAYLLNPEIEEDEDLPDDNLAVDAVVNENDIEAELVESNPPAHRRTFCQELKHNYRIIKQTLKIPAMYNALLFFILQGFTVPSFGEFFYYFSTEVAGFTQFTYSMLALVGSFSFLIGIILYNAFFKDTDVRKLLFAAILIGFVGSIFSLMFVLRLNIAWGISDIAFVMFTGIITDTFALAFSVVPPLVLFAKITPSHVEATMFAFLTSIINAANSFPGKMLGAAINKWFVGVTTEDMSKLWYLVVI